jgi:uncharacterized SAM-binding protein YcdF (DUF218 family)
MQGIELIIAIVDNDCIEKSDAIILLEGDGFNRYKKAVDLYLQGYASKIVFSGGITDYNYGSYPYSDILPRILDLECVTQSDLIHENSSQNTREQAVEVIKLAVTNNWKKLILVASHEHQYRAYLTFLQEVMVRDLSIVIYNAPVRDLKWFDNNIWGRRIDRFNQELMRIDEYFKKGHLAGLKEIIEYQEWKELQAN